jgi:primosomal replication protein N
VACNRTRICGRLADKDTLRHTPAGIALLTFTIVHRSEQTDGAVPRTVECEVPAVASEVIAEKIARWPNGAEVRCEGFLSKKSRTNQQLVLHVQTIELTE